MHKRFFAGKGRGKLLISAIVLALILALSAIPAFAEEETETAATVPVYLRLYDDTYNRYVSGNASYLYDVSGETAVNVSGTKLYSCQPIPGTTTKIHYIKYDLPAGSYSYRMNEPAYNYTVYDFRVAEDLKVYEATDSGETLLENTSNITDSGNVVYPDGPLITVHYKNGPTAHGYSSSVKKFASNEALSGVRMRLFYAYVSTEYDSEGNAKNVYKVAEAPTNDAGLVTPLANLTHLYPIVYLDGLDGYHVGKMTGYPLSATSWALGGTGLNNSSTSLFLSGAYRGEIGDAYLALFENLFASGSKEYEAVQTVKSLKNKTRTELLDAGLYDKWKAALNTIGEDMMIYTDSSGKNVWNITSDTAISFTALPDEGVYFGGKTNGNCEGIAVYKKSASGEYSELTDAIVDGNDSYWLLNYDATYKIELTAKQGYYFKNGLSLSNYKGEIAEAAFGTTADGRNNASGEITLTADNVNLTTYTPYISFTQPTAVPTSGTIQFNTNGGAAVARRNANLNEALGVMPTTWYPDNEFLGWYTDKELTIPFTKDMQMDIYNNSITLYAKWKNEITLYGGGSIQAIGNNISFNPTSGQIGQLIEIIPIYPSEGTYELVSVSSYYGGDCTDKLIQNGGQYFLVLTEEMFGSDVNRFQFSCKIKSFESGSKNDKITGTVYFSLSDDENFVISDGTISDVPMAFVTLDLAEVSKIDLAEHGMSDFQVDYDEDGLWDITLLHTYIYALENYYKDGVGGMSFSGSPGSLYFTSFWGHDENLTYYFNGEYPLESAGWGATADHITVSDGDFVDVTMFSDWSFWSDMLAGHSFFANTDDSICWDFEATAGEPFEFKHIRRGADMTGNYTTATYYHAGSTVYYATTPMAAGASSVIADESGLVSIDFPTAGTWYVWAEGGRNSEGSVVSSPAYAKVTVTGNASSVLYGDLNGDGSITAMDAGMLYGYVNGKIASLTADQSAAADVNNDTQITAMDASMIYGYVNGKLVQFPASAQ